MYFEKPYYLVPAKKAEKGYVLLREVLQKTDKVGVARVVIRTRQYLAAMTPLENALILALMRFPQELVQPDEFSLPSGAAKTHRFTAKEIEMASQLIESMTTKWNPEDYKDEFSSKIRKIIDDQIARQSGKKVKAPRAVDEAETPGAATNVVDFMALLKRSLEKKGQGGATRKSARKTTRRRTRSARRKVS